MQTWLSVYLLANTSALSSIAWVFPQFKTSRPTTKATGTEVLFYGVLYKVRSRYISQENLVSFEHMQKNSVTVLIFSVAGLFYIVIFGLNKDVNKDWYRSVNFQDCILCGAIRDKKQKYLHTLNVMKFLLHEVGLFISNVFFIAVRRPTFWFLDISDNDS